MRPCSRTALALAACLPAAPAWAEGLTEPAQAVQTVVLPAEVQAVQRPAFPGTPQPAALAPAALPLTRLPCADPAEACDANAAAPLRWSLAEVSAAREVPDFSALPLSAEAAEPNYGLTDDVAREPTGPLPPDVPLTRSGHVPRQYARYRGFFAQAGAIRTELLLMGVYLGVQSIPKFFKDTTSFHFHDEGWFGKNTEDVGMDKMTHAFNTYLIAEILHTRLHRNTEASEGDAVTAGILAAGLMAINEMSDAIEPTAGYSMQDITMNLAGATFSVLRNTVPGLKEKLAFKIEIMPNDQIYSHVGKKHYQQERFMFSLKGAGFEGLAKTPLKYLDLQVGYAASNFLNSDREAGIEPRRHLFFGVGLNLGELLFGNSQSRFGRAAYSALDYIQLPYTSLRMDTHGDLAPW